MYDFLTEYSHYSVTRGSGMGVEVEIAPDMIKLEYLAKKRDIDIFEYESYCNLFVSKETEKQQKYIQRKKDNK